MKELDKLIEERGFRDGEVVKIGYNEIVNFTNQKVIEELEDMNLRLRCHPEIKGKSDIDIMFQRKLNELKKEI